MLLNEEQIKNKFKEISTLTDVSDELLLSYCQNSKAFKNTRNHPMHLSFLRATWEFYLFNKALNSKKVLDIYNNTLDAWISFEKYSRNGAVKDMKALLVSNFDSKLIRTMKPTKKHDGYAVYRGQMGDTRMYNNGEMTTHNRRNPEISFSVVFLFSQMELSTKGSRNSQVRNMLETNKEKNLSLHSS
jgi:hypothetical protein